jgi:N-acetylmuramoyl-L-alanine amidase
MASPDGNLASTPDKTNPPVNQALFTTAQPIDPNTPTPAASPTPVASDAPNAALIEIPYVIPSISADEASMLQKPISEAVQKGIVDFEGLRTGATQAGPTVRLRSVKFDGRVLTIDLTGAADLSESQHADLLHAIDMQVSDSLHNATGLQGIPLEYNFLVDGKPLHVLLDGQSGTIDTSSSLVPELISGMQGQKIVINPGHGYVRKLNGSWILQRVYYYGIVEDFINLDLVVDLKRFTLASGADAQQTRQIDKNAGNHSSGYAWWQMGASEYIRSLGAPETVYRPLPYSDSIPQAFDHDIAARPEYANWIRANAMVSVHNNGGGSTNCNSHGTETWYDSANGYQNQSLALAQAIHSKVIQRIRERWDANWCDRGVKGANGNYGENRRFRGPAALVELGFMDVQSDNSALQNATFRAIAMAAINEGLVQYYGGVSCPSISAWRGEYWNNRSLTGYPVMCRNDSSINFNWGTGGPGGSVLNDGFSARWTRTLSFDTSRYRFHVRTDDGVRLWIDNHLVIDKWVDQGATEYTVDRDMSSGTHTIKMEYYENGGGAVAQFWYESIGCTNQYRAEYYNNRYLSGSPTFVRCENWPINHDWGSGGPGNGVGNDNFSARWTGRAYINSGNYTFIARADDGIRVWIGGNLIIDAWRDQVPTEYRVTRYINNGDYDIKVEYYENGGGAVAQFRWEQASSGSYNRLVAKHSGRCMDVYGASRDNGAAIIQWDCHNGDNQAWSLVPAGNDYYKLIAKHSGKCLDVYGASRDNGARLIQWDCHGGDNQLFRREQFGSYYRLRAKHSNRCVDVYGAQRDNGVQLIQWDCHGGDNQLWAIQSRTMAAQDDGEELTLVPVIDEYILPITDMTTTTIIEHTVQEGDSPELMASVYEVSIGTILEANPELSGANAIRPGMVLRIPVHVPHYEIEMPPSDAKRLYLPVVVR